MVSATPEPDLSAVYRAIDEAYRALNRAAGLLVDAKHRLNWHMGPETLEPETPLNPETVARLRQHFGSLK